MRSLAVRSPLTALVLAVLAVPLAACNPVAGTTGALVHCAVAQDQPTSPDSKTIVSTVRYWCDDPGADALSLTLNLQRETSSGGWSNVSSTSFTVSGAKTLRPPDTRYQFRTVAARCSAGTFRTTVTGSSSGAGTFHTTYDLESNSVTDPCAPSP
jgi:hypothetical protein